MVLSYVAKSVQFKVGAVQGHQLCNVYGRAARQLILMHNMHIMCTFLYRSAILRMMLSNFG